MTKAVSYNDNNLLKLIVHLWDMWTAISSIVNSETSQVPQQ